MMSDKSEIHQHGPECGCNAPHPLFGLGVAAIILAVTALIVMVAT